MKALVKAKPQPGIWMEDVPKPVPGDNDVIIKIRKTAICGTDLHIYNWDEWVQEHIPVPLVIGHEFVGDIVEAGRDVTRVHVGQRVSGEGHISCGFCRRCRAGRRHLCRKNESVGITRAGCFAEYLLLPAENVYPLPDSIPDEQAAILDPLGNATHTALAFDLIGEDVLITGAGPVGLMAAAVAKHVGARHVAITDVNPYRLNLAKEMGNGLPVDSKKISLMDVMQQLQMREGFDVGLEMSGNAIAFNAMLNHLSHGAKVALLGFLPKETQIDWNNIIMKGLVVKGIYGRQMFETWYKMICMLQSGLEISKIITHQFSINDYQQAFETVKSGQCGKVILDWTSL